MGLTQRMAPDRRVWLCGEVAEVVFSGVPEGCSAYIRTNHGCAVVRRREIIGAMENDVDVIGRDWHDLPMTMVEPGLWSFRFPVTEVGIFECKCFFVRDGRIVWARGDNLRFKVEPADYAGGNLLYCAFVRQFGPNCRRMFRDREADSELSSLDEKGYTVIPGSGTFRDLIAKLDFIFFELGFRIIQLLPVHPTPVSFGRMGRFGSPFAATDYFSVAQELAEFDPAASAMEQFDELIDAVHARGGKIFLDIPVNHTGWNSRLQTERPDLFVHDEQGRFVSPGAWGVVWADLCKLDYSKDDTVKLMSDVFLFWCRRGVDGFRCDAGYMLPERAWDYIVSKVRLEFPDTVFLLEGLGGPVPVQERLLGVSGLNWAYSELFQNYDRGAIEYYYNSIAPGCRSNGMLLNMAETHDNARLAAVSHQWSKMRCAVNAMLSDAGLFGITNGVEFFAEEKIDVHLDCGLNWGAEDNQVAFLRRINDILRYSSCFRSGAEWHFVQYGSGNFLAVSRKDAAGKNKILTLINLDCGRAVAASWRGAAFDHESAFELFSGEETVISGEGTLELMPGEVKIFSNDSALLQKLNSVNHPVSAEPDSAAECRIRAAALKIWSHFHPGVSFAGDEIGLARKFSESFNSFIRDVSGMTVGGCVHFELDTDLRREVMVFPGCVLAIAGDAPFHFEIMHGKSVIDGGFSMKVAGGRELAVCIIPDSGPEMPVTLDIKFIVYRNGGGVRSEGRLVVLPHCKDIKFDFNYSHKQLFDGDRDIYALLTNDLAGYAQCPADWGTTRSKYDALLAANCNGTIPVDRYVMFSRCRAWLVFRDYSFSLNRNCLSGWSSPERNVAVWHFAVPVGQGMTVKLNIRLEMAHNKNAVRLSFERPASSGENALPDEQPVKIILRPDLEDRVNHTVTKAYTGPEQRFPWSVQSCENGFVFAPAERKLRLVMRHGRYVAQPEWQYMVHLPRENYYGLEDHTDMFSPGYFEQRIKGSESAVLEAEVSWGDAVMESSVPVWPSGKPRPDMTIPDVLQELMNIYTVKRNSLATVIAGYPWFLDWGRDTLICLRGLMAAGKMSDARAIILNFAAFEEHGTIPNMINGTDVSNRDTVDAPLWLIVAVDDYVQRGGEAVLREKCGGRVLIDVLRSIVDNYMAGTPNGIKADPASKLVFAPPHYTWMDTNYPMGTPREGYPVEIQALWFAALSFMGRYFNEYNQYAAEVKQNFIRLFALESGGLSDCLHCASGTPADKAVPDNAIRPNQLFAVTLKLVTEPDKMQGIIESCEKLLVPGAIRSLADAETTPPLPVYWHGVLLNNPSRPYQGRYAGPEDTSRKMAYHNGTAWSWPFPSYVEALMMAGGEAVKPLCRGYLNSAFTAMRSGVPGQLPEVMDGDAPHRWGGCGAQAWSVTEFFRVWKLLDR